MVVGYGGGVRLCVSVLLSVCEDMASDGNAYLLPPLFLALAEKNQ